MITKRMTAAMALLVATGASAAEKMVTIDGGAAPLAGTLLTSEPAKPGAAVLLISGSGPTDRDGNSAMSGIRPATMKLIADGLAVQGIASLRFDKRGLAASRAAATDEGKLRFTTYVDDAAAWAGYLARQPGVRCVVLAGHSEGSLIAIMAAAKVKTCGIVSLSGAGRTAKETLISQMQAAPEPARGQAIAAIDTLAAGNTVDVPQLGPLFRPSVQPYIISWLNIDPAAELAKTNVPVLIVQGQNDIQVPVADAARLHFAKPGSTVLILDGTNHVLKPAPLERAANIAAYAEPTPLDPRVVPAMVTFVKAATP